MNEWMEELWQMICRLYMYWGGKCSDLGPKGPGWIEGLEEVYQTEGPPVFSSAWSRREFLDDLTALEVHLASPDNCLTPEENETLFILIASLRKDIGVSV